MDIQTYKLMMGVAGASTDEPQDHFYLHINHGSSLQSTTHNGWEQVKTGYSNDLTKMGGITFDHDNNVYIQYGICLLYTSPSPRDRTRSRMPSSA